MAPDETKTPLLAIDTSNRYSSAAVLAAGNVLVEACWDAGRDPSAHLAPRLRELMARAPFPPRALAVASGPGGFNSLRVSMAFAKGYCLATGIPLVAVATTEALAASAPPGPRSILTLVPAGRDGYFVQVFDRGSGPIIFTAPCAMKELGQIAALVAAPAMLVGWIATEDLEIIRSMAAHPVETDPDRSERRLAAFVGRVASTKLARNGGDSVLTAIPSYLRAAGTTQPARGWGRA